VFLVNSRFPLVTAASSGSAREGRHHAEALLLPKLRRYFAEFLNHSSPNRLGILYLPTCVGLGYGHRANSLEAFLGSMGSVTSSERLGIASQAGGDRISLGPALHAYPRTTNAWDHLPSCVPPSLPAPGSVGSPEGSPLVPLAWDGRGHGGTGISTGCASTTPLGLALAPDSPWAD
jgi:hypothetical protein